MGLDATTYVLEILNFLVLLWLLQRYLFQPLLKVIRQRQQNMEQAAQQQQQAQERLNQDRQQLEQERSALQEARAQAQQALITEIDQERRKRLQSLDEELSAERAQAATRLAAIAEQQKQEQQRQTAEQALGFLTGYLQRLASPELEQAIIRLFLEDLKQLDEPTCHQLQQKAEGSTLRISTAHPLTTERQQDIEQHLQHLGFSNPCQWLQQPNLLAGIAIELDGHVLEASLKAGLDAFHHPNLEAA